jgi:hypothetical protein
MPDPKSPGEEDKKTPEPGSGKKHAPTPDDIEDEEPKPVKDVPPVPQTPGRGPG